MARPKFNFNRARRAKKIYFKLPISWHSIIATWFFVGKLPSIPGTFGSIAAYPIYYLTCINTHSYSEAKSVLLIWVMVLLILGSIATKRLQEVTRTHDHGCIVIDEVIGQLFTLYISFEYLFKIVYILPFNNTPTISATFVMALIPFRYFDIKKPLIIGYVNNNYKGTFGVIFDDILAAVFSSVTIYIVYLIINAIY
jgi:phosphatidylglycerophosphatase A